jgi:hypothetical protein
VTVLFSAGNLLFIVCVIRMYSNPQIPSNPNMFPSSPSMTGNAPLYPQIPVENSGLNVGNPNIPSNVSILLQRSIFRIRVNYYDVVTEIIIEIHKPFNTF